MLYSPMDCQQTHQDRFSTHNQGPSGKCHKELRPDMVHDSEKSSELWKASTEQMLSDPSFQPWASSQWDFLWHICLFLLPGKDKWWLVQSWQCKVLTSLLEAIRACIEANGREKTRKKMKVEPPVTLLMTILYSWSVAGCSGRSWLLTKLTTMEWLEQPIIGNASAPILPGQTAPKLSPECSTTTVPLFSGGFGGSGQYFAATLECLGIGQLLKTFILLSTHWPHSGKDQMFSGRHSALTNSWLKSSLNFIPLSQV